MSVLSVCWSPLTRTLGLITSHWSRSSGRRAELSGHLVASVAWCVSSIWTTLTPRLKCCWQTLFASLFYPRRKIARVSVVWWRCYYCPCSQNTLWWTSQTPRSPPAPSDWSPSRPAPRSSSCSRQRCCSSCSTSSSWPCSDCSGWSPCSWIRWTWSSPAWAASWIPPGRGRSPGARPD